MACVEAGRKTGKGHRTFAGGRWRRDGHGEGLHNGRKMHAHAIAVAHRPGDGARAHEVARSDVTSGDRVVGELLLHGPVHVLEVGLGHRAGGGGARGLDGDREVDVEVVVVLVGEVPGEADEREGEG